MTTFAADIDALKVRIAAAESKRSTWLASGMQEKYLEACSMVDALELQLGQLEVAARKAALVDALSAVRK